MIDSFASAFSHLLLKAALPSVAVLLAVLAAAGAWRVVGSATRRIRRVGGISLSVFLGLWLFAMTEKGSPPTRGEKEQMRGAQSEVSEERAVIGGILAGLHDKTQPDAKPAGENSSKTKGDNSASKLQRKSPTIGNRDNTANPAEITADEYAAGFALVRVGTGESFDFSPPLHVIVCEEWRRFGAAGDRQHLYLIDEANDGYVGFPFGTNVIQSLVVYSDGEARVATTNAVTTISPLKCVAGILPASRWEWSSASPSQFWSSLTPSNTFVMTWQNVAFTRYLGYPVSFQAELFENGDMEFRYDLSNLDEESVTNVVAGALNGGVGTIFNEIPTATTSLRFARLDPTRANDPDPDGDGIATADELFVYHTNPYASDSDHDGLSDYAEVNETNTDPNDAYSVNGVYNDGLAVALGGMDPFACPEGSTNSMLEHLFYSGTTNGVFAYPTSTDEIGVLKIMVSGTGTGRMVVGDDVIPLVGFETGLTRLTGLRGGTNPVNPVNPVTNTLLLAIGKGERKELWWDKPEGLDVAVHSDDLLIGVLPSPLRWKGWIAFPHTGATIPCIHDLYAKQKVVTLIHGEEFSGLTATWSSASQDVDIDDRPPVSAEITGSFPRTASRIVTYEVSHPKRLNESPVVLTQEARFCPQLSDSDAVANGVEDEDVEPLGGWCSCYGSWWCWCDGRCGEVCPCCDPTADDQTAESASAAEYARVSALQEASGVLQLYGAYGREDVVQLQVPSGEPVRCCDCPEHWQSNHVSLAWHSSRLEVKDAYGADFGEAHEDTSVRVRGLYPSYGVGKDSLLFATNGVPSDCRRYTVLGVNVERPYGVPLETYNALNATFGFPMTICTNLQKSAALTLRTYVMLTNGVFRLALENVTGKFEVWLPDSWIWDEQQGHEVHRPAVKLLEGESMQERYFTVRQWRKLLAERSYETHALPVLMLSPESGHCDLCVSFVGDSESHAIKSSARQRVTSVVPPLIPDYNRDGRLNGLDQLAYLGEDVFYFWTNEDVWRGDYAFESVDSHFSEPTLPRNNTDLVVNGRNDLVNLFPFALRVAPFSSAWGGGVSARIRAHDGRQGNWGRLAYDRYFLLNAAVPVEAFDPSTDTRTEDMTPDAWKPYDRRLRPTGWYGLFPASDGRRLLTWKGRFSSVTNTVNFYSTEEEVVNNGDGAKHDMFDRNYVWYNQEYRKGRYVGALGSNEGGWTFNAEWFVYGLLPGSSGHGEPHYGLRARTPEETVGLTDAQLMAASFFGPFDDDEIYGADGGALVTETCEYRALLLSHSIPSESFATGANPVPAWGDRNIDMATQFMSGRGDFDVDDDRRKWVHSYFVSRPLMWTFDLYDRIIKLMKEQINQDGGVQ